MGVRVEVGSVKELVERRRRAGYGGSGFVLGTPGAGKTAVVIEQIREILQNSEDAVVVLDADGSYREFARAVGGQVVPVGIESGVFVNPLDLNPDSCGLRDIGRKVAFMNDWFGWLLGNEVTSRQKSLLQKALQKVYGRFWDSMDLVTEECDPSRLPTLADLYGILRCYNDDADMKLLADVLEVFVNGSVKCFSQQTNVVHESQLVVYDFSPLGYHLIDQAMLVVLESLKERIVSDRCAHGSMGELVWLFVDDCYPILKSERSVQYLRDFCKSLRRFGFVFTGVTQNVSAFFDWDASKVMLIGADYVHLMRQAEADRRALRALLDLWNVEIPGADVNSAGTGLVVCGGEVFPMNGLSG